MAAGIGSTCAKDTYIGSTYAVGSWIGCASIGDTCIGCISGPGINDCCLQLFMGLIFTSIDGMNC